MNEARNSYGFPFISADIERGHQLGIARHIAEQARKNNKPECMFEVCPCEGCVTARGLPMVQRILAKWTPLVKFQTEFL